MDDRKELRKARLAIFGGVAFVVIVIVTSCIGMIMQDKDKKKEPEGDIAPSLQKPTDEVIATGAQDSFYRLMNYFLYGKEEAEAGTLSLSLEQANNYYYNKIAQRGKSAEKYAELVDAFVKEYDDAKIDELEHDRRGGNLIRLKTMAVDLKTNLIEMPNYTKDYLYSYYVGYGLDALKDKIANSYVNYYDNKDSRMIADYASALLTRDQVFVNALEMMEQSGCLKVSRGSWTDGSKELSSEDAITCGEKASNSDKIKPTLAAYDTYDSQAFGELRTSMFNMASVMFQIQSMLEGSR